MTITKFFESVQLKNKLIILGIILYPFLFIWQGGDLTDSGYFAYNYSVFFENLHKFNFSGLMIFLDFCGAWCLKIFPFIIGLNILFILFLLATCFVVFLILKDYYQNKTVLLFGILAGELFAIRYNSLMFNYDISSILFLLLSMLFIIKGLSKGKYGYLFLGGCFSMIAILFRISDVLIVVCVPLFFIFEHYKFNTEKLEKNRLKLVQKVFIYWAGSVAVTLAFLIFLYLYGLLDVYFKSIFLNSKALIQNKYINFSFDELITFVYYFFGLGLLIFIFSKFAINRLKEVIFILFILFISYFLFRNFSYTNPIKYVVPAFFLWVVLFVFLDSSLIEIRNKYQHLLLIGSLITLVQVAGTNTGIFQKMCFGFMFLIPLMVLLMNEINDYTLFKLTIDWKKVVRFFLSFILFICFILRFGWIFHVGAGIGIRMKSTYPIEHSFMKGIYTTKENSFYINSLTTSIKRNSNETQPILIYGHQPLFYYLSERKPCVKYIWLKGIDLNPDVFLKELSNSIYNNKQYPLIINTKEFVLGNNFETKMISFLKKNKYEIIEETARYSIWKHSSSK